MDRARAATDRRLRPRLTVAQILRWADAHWRRTGDWPTARSGPVAGSAGLTWQAVQTALAEGHRGLPGGDALGRLLRRQRPVPGQRIRPGSRARHQEAARLRELGLGLAAIGSRLGVTPQRVWQMLRGRPREGTRP